MKKKIIISVIDATLGALILGSTVLLTKNMVEPTKASIPSHTITWNKTVSTIPSWPAQAFNSKTENGNTLTIGYQNGDEYEGALCSLRSNGSGINLHNPIQHITSFTITYSMPSVSNTSMSINFNDDGSYTGEEFEVDSNSEEGQQTATYTVTAPENANYFVLWYSSSGSAGPLVVYEISLTYVCS